MKLIERLENFSLIKKMILILIVTILIAIGNFFFYNYQSLKLPANERTYSLNLDNGAIINLEKQENNTLKSTSNVSKMVLNLENKYVKNLMIKYKTKNDFKVELNSEIANNYGVLKGGVLEDRCYQYSDTCGFSINQKVGNLEFNLDQQDIEILEVRVDNAIYFNWNTFIFWEISIMLILVIFIFNKLLFKNQHLLALILCLGIGTIFLTSTHNMTSTTLDDDTHYRMAESLSSDFTDADLYYENYIYTFHSQNTRIEKQNFQNYINSISNNKMDTLNSKPNLFVTNKINYLPEGITLKVTSWLGLNYTTCFFIARVVQLLIYSFAIMFAVKIIPNFKLLTIIIGILPQSLFLATNFSYDPTVTGFTILAFAAFAHEFLDKNKKVDVKYILLFLLAGLYGIFPKAIFSPFILLLLLLPETKFETKKQYRLFRLCIIGIFLLSMMTFILPLLTDESTRSDLRGGDTSAVRQLEVILKQPISFIKTFWKSAILTTPEKLIGPSTFGILSYYGGMGIDVCYFLILFSLLGAFIVEKNYPEITIKQRIFMFIIYAFIICSIWGSMYLVFTPVGEATINGVQNRYFIPLLLPIFYLLSNKNLKNNIDSKKAMTILCILCIFAICLLIYKEIILDYCL